MEWIADPTAWLGLATLIVLEIVLGIDNLVFIAILADKLPPHLRDRARVLGLSLALLMRLGLLASISWMVTSPSRCSRYFGKSFSGRDLIMLFGGVFLLFMPPWASTKRLEAPCRPARRQQDLRAVLADRRADRGARRGVLARRGDHRGGHGRAPEVMMIAVIVSIGLMIVASKPLTRFVNRHPTVIMLCLGFLMMIGFSLTAEGLGFPYPERLPVRGHRLLDPHRGVQPGRPQAPQEEPAGHRPLRARVPPMRCCACSAASAWRPTRLGGEVADLFEEGDDQVVFDRRERVR